MRARAPRDVKAETRAGVDPRRVALLGTLLAAAAALLTPAASAQTGRGHFRGARLPSPGEAWLELSSSFESWDSQYALDSPADSVADGSEEPLWADADGPIVNRVYPGAEAFLAGLRQDADALGYDSLPAEEFSLGGLRFDRLQADRRQFPLTVEVGILERLAARVTVPLVKTKTEAFFTFEPEGASFAPLGSVVSEPGAFISEWSAARASLQERIDGGELTEEQRSRARTLLEESGAFLDAFRRRAEAGLLLPLGESRPGGALASHANGLAGDFGQFGIEAPFLSLSGSTDAAALQTFFRGGLMDADSLRGREQGWSLEGVELGVRVGLLDTFRPVSDTAAGGLQLRTTAGAALRVPNGAAGSAPFVTPASFLDVPVSEAQTDLQLSLYQDLRLGALLLQGRARYGLQLADELELRVHPPDRPFPVASASATVERDLGDYLEVHLSPRLAMNRALSIGAEYSYWRKEADRYALAGGEGGEGAPDVSPLAVESTERRHRLGIGLHYRAAGEETSPGDRPVELSFLFQAPVGGSGGQTPVSQITSFRLRVPVGVPSPDLPFF